MKSFIDFCKKPLCQIFLIFVVTRLLIFVMGALSYSIFPERGFVHEKKTISDVLSVQDMWDRFDSGWYQKLAQEGYPQRPFTDNIEETWGFMPLYSLMMNVMSRITGWDLFTNGILISNGCTFLALYFFYKLVEEKYGKGMLAVSLIMISAGSFYLSIVYPSGLYLLLTSLVFYLSYKKKFGWAFIIAGLASVARIHGCLLFVIPGVDILLNHRQYFYRYIPAFLIALLPMALFMLYLEITCGEPLAFIKIQHSWGSKDLFPLQGFLSLFKGVRPGGSFTNTFFWLIIAWTIISTYRKLPLSYLVFTWLYFLISTSNAELFESTRYMIGLLPVFIAVSIGSDYMRQIFILINILFLSLTISAFVTHSMTFI